MGTGYTRNDVSNNIADGNIINAADLDGEFDAVESAFNSSTGHTHDGTSAEGGPITVVGPVQDLVVSATEVKPKTTNTLDLGTSALLYKDAYLQGNMYFRDTALKIVSSADGQLDIDADVELELVAPTVDIDASTAVTIDTATLTITGSANVVGDLDVDNININGNTIISTDTNGNIALTPNGTGEVDISKVDIASGEIDGTTIGANSAAAITGTTITGTSFVSSGDMTFGDSDKAVFGAGSDLQIYHDGSNSFIDDAGTGNLLIRSNRTIIQKYTGEVAGDFVADGEAALYYDNNKKIATTATGIDVTGTVTADGLTISASDPYITLTDSDTGVDHEIDGQSGIGNLAINVDKNSEGSNSGFVVNVKGNQYMRVDDGGDISFYDSTGVTQGLFWDASTQRLGVGSTSPSFALEVNAANGGGLSVVGASDTNSGWRLKPLGNDLYISQNGISDNVVFKDGGDVLVAKTTSGVANTGAEIQSSGFTSITRDGGPPLQLNRKTSDGDLFVVKKDGTTVGSIGTAGGNVIINSSSAYGILQNAGSNQYVWSSSGGASAFYPEANNSKDLGTSTKKFKDLYLSNAAYVNVIRGQGDTDTGMDFSGSNIVKIQTGGSERVRIDSSGNVGIGTTSPDRLLDIESNVPAMRLSDTTTSGLYHEILGDGDSLSIEADDGNVGSSSSINFKVGGTQLMTITSAGEIQVTGDGGGSQLESVFTNSGTAGNDNSVIRIRIGGTTARSVVQFGDDDDNNAGQIDYDHDIDAMLFDVSASQVIRLDSDGLKFNTDTSADNALDDYEQGSWTVDLQDNSGNSATSINGNGRYIKVGNIVTVWGRFSDPDLTGLTSGDDVRIYGLPFTASAFTGDGLQFIGSVRMENVTFASSPDGYVNTDIGEGTTNLRLVETRNNAGDDFITVNQLSATSEMRFTATYPTTTF